MKLFTRVRDRNLPVEVHHKTFGDVKGSQRLAFCDVTLPHARTASTFSDENDHRLESLNRDPEPTPITETPIRGRHRHLLGDASNRSMESSLSNRVGAARE